MSLEKIAEAPAPITSLATFEGVLIASVSTGHITFLDERSSSNNNNNQKQLELLLDTHGGPRGLAVDKKSGDVFFTDSIRKAVVKLELPSSAGSAAQWARNNGNNNNNVTSMYQLWDVLKNSSISNSNINAATVWQQSTQLRSFIDSFMDTPLKGPHGLAFDSRGEIYVSDPGAFGDSGLTNPTGTILRSIANCQQVVPLASSGLGYPAGVACNESTGAIFVCELAKNRLVRFISRTPFATSSSSSNSSNNNNAPASSMFGSVFHQFSGGMGPMSVVVDSEDDLIYVARYDFAHANNKKNGTATGEVLVLQGDGEVMGAIKVPGTEITALALDKIKKRLFIAEGKNLYSIKLSSQ